MRQDANSNEPQRRPAMAAAITDHIWSVRGIWGRPVFWRLLKLALLGCIKPCNLKVLEGVSPVDGSRRDGAVFYFEAELPEQENA
jgi:hypothetical protein